MSTMSMKAENPHPTESQQTKGAADPAADSTVREDSATADPVAELQAKVVNLEDSLLRARADFQNLQRRAALEYTDAVRYANVELLKSLVEVVDDFERSLAAAPSPDNLPALLEGVHLVYKNLTKALSNHGLDRVDALNRPFDPAVHEALLHQPSDAHPPGMVIEEIAKGYRLRDRVVRPAKVIVSKSVEPAASADPGDNKQTTGTD